MPRPPCPRSFLYLMSLRTGTELITLLFLLNKVSGFFGLLALFTGLHLSPLQLSMYLYSLVALVVALFLAPHIRRQAPLQCLALAWLYIVDSVINAAYTLVFGLTWFLVLSQAHSDAHGDGVPASGGGRTMDEAAGFTSPEHNVSRVEVIATPGSGLVGGQDAVAVGKPADGVAASASTPSLSHGVLMPESATSISIIVMLWLVRVYFVLVVMAHARAVLRTFTMHQPLSSGTHKASEPSSPFSPHQPEGQGWRGRLGRILVSVGRSYWLGHVDDADYNLSDDWTIRAGGRFDKLRGRSAATGLLSGSGPNERERRRRSGTGPPPPHAAASPHSTIHPLSQQLSSPSLSSNVGDSPKYQEAKDEK
ncbi:MAG: hypothetical protein M1838_002557 [Thelocarpon superellum]|nr:MAG: hypothetical protein M1838_002557 [Thelocarpon superellum]